MPTYGGGATTNPKSKGSTLLSPPPRVGTLSINSQKTLAHLLSLLSTIVIFGSVSNTRVVRDISTSLTTFIIIWTVILCILYLVLLALTYQAQPKTPWAPKLDMLLWSFVLLLWIPVVGVTSSFGNGFRNVTTWFAWIGWASVGFVVLKAYHAWVESDLPTPNPEGFDDDDYIYG